VNTADYLTLLSALAPEVIVVLTALLVLAVDLLGLQDTPRSYRMSIAAGLTTLRGGGGLDVHQPDRRQLAWRDAGD